MHTEILLYRNVKDAVLRDPENCAALLARSSKRRARFRTIPGEARITESAKGGSVRRSTNGSNIFLPPENIVGRTGGGERPTADPTCRRKAAERPAIQIGPIKPAARRGYYLSLPPSFLISTTIDSHPHPRLLP